MKSIKQILEQYEPLEKSATDKDRNNLVSLARAGLLDESKIPMLARAMKKNVNEMTVGEKKALQELVESLSAHVIHEQKEYFTEAKQKQGSWDKDVPAVIVLRRKAIRVYPDNQKIALYFSQALNRHISIPFGPNVNDIGPQINEDYLIGNRNQLQEEQRESPEMSGNPRETFRRKLSQIREEQLDEALPLLAAAAVPFLARAGMALAPLARKYGPKIAEKAYNYLRRGTQGAKQLPAKGARKEAREKRLEKSREQSEKQSPAEGARDPKTGRRGVSRGTARNAVRRRQKAREAEAREAEKAPGTLRKVIGGAGAAAVAKALGAGLGADENDLLNAKKTSDRIIGAQGGIIDPKAQGVDRVNLDASAAAAYGPNQFFGSNPKKSSQYNESTSNPIDLLAYIVESEEAHIISFGENEITINKGIAKKILNVHESLSKRNQKKFEKMLTEDAESFKNAVNFVLRQ